MSNNLRDFYREKYVSEYDKKPISRLRRLIKYMDLDGSESVVDYA
jgi:hypothetical protein